MTLKNQAICMIFCGIISSICPILSDAYFYYKWVAGLCFIWCLIALSNHSIVLSKQQCALLLLIVLQGLMRSFSVIDPLMHQLHIFALCTGIIFVGWGRQEGIRNQIADLLPMLLKLGSFLLILFTYLGSDSLAKSNLVGPYGNSELMVPFFGMATLYFAASKSKWTILPLLGLLMCQSKLSLGCVAFMICHHFLQHKSLKIKLWFWSSGILGLTLMPFVMSFHTLVGRVFLWLCTVFFGDSSSAIFLGLGWWEIEHSLLNAFERFSQYSYYDWFKGNPAMVKHLHNEYLNLFLEMGLTSIMALWLCWSTLKTVASASIPPKYQYPLRYMLLFALFSLPFRSMANYVVFLTLIALVPLEESQASYTFKKSMSQWVALGMSILIAWSSLPRLQSSYYTQKAMHLYAQDERVSTLEMLEIAESSDPFDLETQRFLIQFHDNSGNTYVAIQKAENYLLKSQHIDIAKIMMHNLIQIGRYEDAIFWAQRMHNIFPHHITPLFLWGQALYLNEQYLESRDIFEQALLKKSTSDKGRFEQAQIEYLYLPKIQDILSQTPD